MHLLHILSNFIQLVIVI